MSDAFHKLLDIELQAGVWKRFKAAAKLALARDLTPHS